MDFFRNNDNLSLDDYKEILENYDSKFEILFNLKEGMKIGKTAQETEKKEQKQETEKKEQKQELEKKEQKQELEKKEQETEQKETEQKETKETEQELEKELEQELEKELEKKEQELEKKEQELKQKRKKKLMIKGEYCIYNNNMYQKLSRWWYNENREKTFGYLDKDFTKFVKYLDLIKIEVQSFNSIYYKKLSNNIKKLINRIIPGLYNLKKTYSDEKKIVAKVDSIILILIDFKTEISKKKNKKKNHC